MFIIYKNMFQLMTALLDKLFLFLCLLIINSRCLYGLPDPEVIAFIPVGSTAVLIPDTPVVFPFALKVENVAPTISANHIPSVTAPAANFAFTVVFSDVNTRTSTSPNTLAAVTSGTPTMKTPSDLQLGLLAGSFLSMPGQVTITLPAAHCTAAQFMCLNFQPGTGSTYTDANTALSSNSYCVPVNAWKVCAPDPAITLFEDGKAEYKAGVPVTISYKLTLRNEAKSGAGAGNDIPVVTSPKTNFQIQMQFSDIDMQAKKDTLSDTPVTVTLSPVSDHSRALAALTEFNTVGTQALTLPAATCTQVHYVCAILTVPTGAIYIDVNKGSWSNIQCILIDDRKSCSPDPAIDSFSETSTTFIKPNTPFTLKVAFTVKNVAAGPASTGNDIEPVSSPNENYDIRLKLSDADLGAGNPDGLTSQVAVIATVSENLQQGLAASTGSFTSTGSASFTVTVADCPNVKFICVILKEGSGAGYADANQNNNMQCSNVEARKTCSPDPEISLFKENSGNIFISGKATTATFELIVGNAATGVSNDILAVSGGDANYAFDVFLSDKNVKSVADTLGLSTVTPTMTADLTQGLAAGSSFPAWLGSASVTVPSGSQCPSVLQICVRLKIPATASYVDLNPADGSNARCESLIGRLACNPDPEITDFKETGTLAISSGATLLFSIVVKNAAVVGNGNDIIAVTPPNKNFDLKVQFSDVDMQTGTDSLNSPPSSATIKTGDGGRGLAAQKTFTTTGTATAAFASVNCPKVKYLCNVMTVGTGASYNDAKPDAVSNIFCDDVKDRIVCSPDPAMKSFTLPSGLKLKPGVATAVLVTTDIKNEAATGHNIVSVTDPSQNFVLELSITDGDISAGQPNTLGEPVITVPISPASDLQGALDAGVTKTMSGAASVTLSSAACPNAKFFCLVLKDGSGASFTDSVKSNNVMCLDILQIKECSTDIRALNVLEPSNVVFYQDVATSVSFSTLFTTLGPDGIVAVTGTDYNFDVKIKMSTANGGVGPLPETFATITPNSDRQHGLGVGGAVTLGGTVSVTIPATQCSTVKFLCVHVVPFTTAPISDPVDTNNWICKDVQTQIRCDTDPTITSITDTAAPVFHQDVAVPLNLVLKLKNDVLVSVGNDILAVNDPNRNFAFTLVLSDADLSAGKTNTLGLAAVTPTISSNDLKQELKAGAEKDVPASASLTLTGAACAAAAYFCACVAQGTGAFYRDTDTTNNCYCLDITARKSCRPDPAVISFEEPANAAIMQDVATTLDINIRLENKAGAASGNDITPVTTSDTNFAFDIIISDIDINQVDSSLGLPAYTPTFTGTVLSQGLQAGPSKAVTLAGKVTFTLPQASCIGTRFLCVVLKEGTGASYKDGNDLNNKMCKDIQQQKGCNADPTPILFETTPSGIGFIQNKDVTTQFTVKVENVAIGVGSGIKPGTSGPNYEICLRLSDRDLGTGVADTLKINEITTTITPTADLKQGILVGAGNDITLTGSATLKLPPSKCADITYLCVFIKQTATSTFIDANLNNNYRCINIVNRKSCRPDLEVDLATELDGPAIFLEDKPATFRFTLRLINTAENLSGNRIHTAVSPAINYDVKAYLSNGDVGAANGANTFGGGTLAITLTSPSELLVALPVGGVTFIRGQMSVTISKADCPDTSAKYICFDVKPHLLSEWKDVLIDYKNTKCLSIEYQKKCIPEYLNLPTTAKVTVTETETASREVYAIQIQDGNLGDKHVYSYVSDHSPAPFTINKDGKVLLHSNPGLDYEGGPQKYTLNISVTDSYYTIYETLEIEVLEDPEDPYFTNLPKGLIIDEHHVDKVYDVIAIDEDVGDKVTYKLISVIPPGPFIFDVKTGELSLPSAPSLDHETQTFYRLNFEAKDKTGRKVQSYLNITVTNINEAPNITNLPALRDVTENVKVGKFLFKIEAWDPENHNITYKLNPDPSDGNFILRPPGSPYIYLVDTPDLDRERTMNYTLNVIATDGVLFSLVHVLYVEVLDVNEPPYLKKLPAIVAVLENVKPNKQIYKSIGPKDPENKTMTYKVFSSPPSGNLLFSVIKGQVRVTQTPVPLDYETVKAYNLSIQACDDQFCSEPGYLVVDVLDAMEPPVFTPKSGTYDLHENTPVGSTLNITLAFFDPDANDVHSFTSLPSTYSNCFFVHPNTGKIQLAKEIDYETMPHTITFDIAIQDNSGNEDTYHLTLNIINANEHSPVFTKSVYDAGELDENSVGDTVVAIVSASDADAGAAGNIQYVIDDEPAKTFFKVTKDIGTGKGIVAVKSPIDREKFDSLEFNVYAVDGVGTRVPAKVKVKITDVNDNRPVFAKAFHNFEIRYDAPAGTSIGKVTASDADATGNQVTYGLAPGKGNAEDFSMLLNQGVLAVKNKLSLGRVYEVYALAKDTGTPVDTSVATLMRVDPFDPVLYLLDMEVSGSPQSFTDAKKQTFIDKMKTQCPPCVPRIAEVKASDKSEDRSVLQVYFLRNANTDNGDLAVNKEFMGVEEILAEMTTDSEGRPTAEVSKATEADFPMYSIKRSLAAPEAPEPAWIDTLAGQLTVALLALAGFVGLVTGVTMLAKYLSNNPLSFLKSGRKNLGNKPTAKGKWDSRYANKAHSRPTDTRVHNMDETNKAWRKDFRRPPTTSDKRPKINRDSSAISSRKVELQVNDGPPRNMKRPSPRISDQRRY